jgi:hypothetical protein
MGTEKIAQFYSDHDKLAADRHSLQLARFREALTSNTDVRWTMQRKLHFLRRMVTHQVDRIHPGWVMRVRSALR